MVLIEYEVHNVTKEEITTQALILVIQIYLNSITSTCTYISILLDFSKHQFCFHGYKLSSQSEQFVTIQWMLHSSNKNSDLEMSYLRKGKTLYVRFFIYLKNHD